MSDRKEQEILNGKFTLITEFNEFKMSLWVNGFGIIENNTQKEILPFNSSFDLQDFTEKGTTVDIKFRIYPNGAKTYLVSIDLFEEYFIYLTKRYSLKEFTANLFELDSSI